jgi:hypothetical protein
MPVPERHRAKTSSSRGHHFAVDASSSSRQARRKFNCRFRQRGTAAYGIALLSRDPVDSWDSPLKAALSVRNSALVDHQHLVGLTQAHRKRHLDARQSHHLPCTAVRVRSPPSTSPWRAEMAATNRWLTAPWPGRRAPSGRPRWVPSKTSRSSSALRSLAERTVVGVGRDGGDHSAKLPGVDR